VRIDEFWKRIADTEPDAEESTCVEIKKPGNDLLSHSQAAVPSARQGLTSVFGMGTGGSPAPLSPGKFFMMEREKPTQGIGERGGEAIGAAPASAALYVWHTPTGDALWNIEKIWSSLTVD
jgi:hypothetical protein